MAKPTQAQALRDSYMVHGVSHYMASQKAMGILPYLFSLHIAFFFRALTMRLRRRGPLFCAAAAWTAALHAG